MVTNLIVRNLDDGLVQALKERAVEYGHSAEAEHREILERALRRPRRKTLAQVLMSMPNVGEDADFARRDDDQAAHVFA